MMVKESEKEEGEEEGERGSKNIKGTNIKQNTTKKQRSCRVGKTSSVYLDMSEYDTKGQHK